VWIGYAVYGLAFGAAGLIGLVPQAIIIASIFGVTGITPTENQAIRSNGAPRHPSRKQASPAFSLVVDALRYRTTSRR
jgi:hypothetical protein